MLNTMTTLIEKLICKTSDKLVHWEFEPIGFRAYFYPGWSGLTVRLTRTPRDSYSFHYTIDLLSVSGGVIHSVTEADQEHQERTPVGRLYALVHSQLWERRTTAIEQAIKFLDEKDNKNEITSPP